MEIERKWNTLSASKRLLPARWRRAARVSTDRREKGRKSEDFRMGLKVWGGFAFLWVLLSLLPWLCMLTPSCWPPSGLAHFGGWGSLCSLCICGRGGSPQPWPWRWSSVPGGGCLPSWAAHDLWIQQSLKACFSGASVHTTHPSGALWAVSQYLWGSHRAPCSEGLSFTLPLPHFPYGRTVLYCDFSHRRYWKQEDERAKKNGQKPSLKKAIIKCYWKSYLLSAIFVFSEVKAFTYSALLSLYMGQYWNGCDWWERPVV